MALINVDRREIQAKIVYYGPALSGKTTNLRYIHDHVPASSRGDLLSVETNGERTLFFDFLPLNAGTVQGFSIRLHLYTVPGQVIYQRTRIAVLTGVDGVVFVADARRDRLTENLQSLRELAELLTNQGKEFLDFPLVLQYNKMDLADTLPVDALDRYLNALNAPHFEAIATEGEQVLPTLSAASKLVIGRL